MLCARTHKRSKTLHHVTMGLATCYKALHRSTREAIHQFFDVRAQSSHALFLPAGFFIPPRQIELKWESWKRTVFTVLNLFIAFPKCFILFRTKTIKTETF